MILKSLPLGLNPPANTAAQLVNCMDVIYAPNTPIHKYPTKYLEIFCYEILEEDQHREVQSAKSASDMFC